MEQVVGLSGKERERLVELEQVKTGRQTVREAQERLGISERQARRIWKRFKAEGVLGLVHRGRGRPSNRAMDVEVKRRSVEFYRERLEGFGPTLAAEKLCEAGLRVGHETLRRWLIGEGLWKRRRKRGPHRRWRPRKEHFGELVQMDGSFHDWFETGEQSCLIDMVDDATSTMTGRFFQQETTEGAMRVLWEWIERHGVPRALYTDHKTVYVTPRQPSPEILPPTCPSLGPSPRPSLERRHRSGLPREPQPPLRPRPPVASRGVDACRARGKAPLSHRRLENAPRFPHESTPLPFRPPLKLLRKGRFYRVRRRDISTEL
jgi:transposase